MNNKIVFDDIHTKDKQKRLEEQFELVSKIIHDKFKKLDKVKSCPCCGSINISKYIVKFGFNLDICKDCKHIFTNPFPCSGSLDFFYNSDYKKFENKFFKESFEKRIPIFTYRLLEIQKYLLPGDSVLDIGSSLGIFLEANNQLKTKLDVTSCDISSDACNLLRSKFPNNNIINSDFMKLSDEFKFKCITLWDTFEHIPDPSSCLRKIRSVLVGDGIFAFSTPNTVSAEWLFAGKKHPQLLPPGHVNLYNRDNIKIILEQNGFKCESIITPNASLDISFIKKIMNTDRKDLSKQDRDPNLYSYDDLLFSLFGLEGFEANLESLLKVSKFAGNMFIIARRI